MSISSNKNQREFDSLVETRSGLTARRVTVDPHTAAMFHLNTAIANGVDLTNYMVNDFGEILIDDNGSLLTE